MRGITVLRLPTLVGPILQGERGRFSSLFDAQQFHGHLRIALKKESVDVILKAYLILHEIKF
jgi:hypothetical protein